MNKPKVQKNGEPERRAKRRFRLELDVGYKILTAGQGTAETGKGRTQNISSGGIWFTTERPLAAGALIELAMDWPVLLNDACPMKLMIYGTVIRSNDQGAAALIERYDFRTRASRTLQPSWLLEDKLRKPGAPRRRPE